MKKVTFSSTANEKQFRGQLAKIVAAGVAVNENIQDAIEFALGKYLGGGVLSESNTGFLTDIAKGVAPLGHKIQKAVIDYIKHRANVVWSVPTEEGKFPHFKKHGKHPEVKDCDVTWFEYAKPATAKGAPKPVMERIDRFCKTISREDDIVAMALASYVHSSQFEIAVNRLRAAKEERAAREVLAE